MEHTRQQFPFFHRVVVPPHVRAQLHSRWFTISNILTAARLCSTPFIVWGLLIGWHKLVFALFVGAGITDMLDGYLARLRNEQTVVGAYLDPVADKVLLTSCFCTLAWIQLETVSLPWWFVATVLVRELVILCGAVLVVWRNPRASVAPTLSGKLTTAGYMVLIGWLLTCHFGGWLPHKSFFTALVVVALFAVASLLQYVWRGVLAIRNILR